MGGMHNVIVERPLSPYSGTLFCLCSLFSLFSFLFILQEETAYYDEPLYEYAYEYADSTEAEYVEEKAEEALETVPNQISKRRRKRSSPVKR